MRRSDRALLQVMETAMKFGVDRGNMRHIHKSTPR